MPDIDILHKEAPGITQQDIEALVGVILAKARFIQPNARRRRCAAEYIFKRLVEMGVTKLRVPILGADKL